MMAKLALVLFLYGSLAVFMCRHLFVRRIFQCQKLMGGCGRYALVRWIDYHCCEPRDCHCLCDECRAKKRAFILAQVKAQDEAVGQ